MRKQGNILIIGGGYIGGNIFNILRKKGLKVKIFKRNKIDLVKYSSINKLKRIIKNGDRIIFTAAKAPVKNHKMFLKNMHMIKNFYEAIKEKNLSHFLYLSSDAVYSDSTKSLKENSLTLPDSLHGIMHITRELFFKSIFKKNICVARPTLVYGINDPHNGYGPNSFYRLAVKGRDINLFGKGEELRDHVSIKDVSSIISKLCIYKKIGTYNISSGKLISFFEIAKKIKHLKNSNSKIIFNKRTQPMPHNGYRPISNKKVKKELKYLKFSSIENIFK